MHQTAAMSYQAYLANIQAKTGRSPADFRKIAERKGFTKQGRLAEGVKAGAIVKWLKEDHQLGHGHAMAIYALLRDPRTSVIPDPPPSRAKRTTGHDDGSCWSSPALGSPRHAPPHRIGRPWQAIRPAASTGRRARIRAWSSAISSVVIAASLGPRSVP